MGSSQLRIAQFIESPEKSWTSHDSKKNSRPEVVGVQILCHKMLQHVLKIKKDQNGPNRPGRSNIPTKRAKKPTLKDTTNRASTPESRF
jgi:hypothetical protein